MAQALDRTPAACRQLASRARIHLRSERPRFVVTKEQGLRVAAAFFAASRSGDISALRALLAEDVIACADGGGKVPATLTPLIGIDAVLGRHAEMAVAFARSPSQLLRYAVIDGLPGFLTVETGDILQVTALHIRDARIIDIYVTRNPDKLKRARRPPRRPVAEDATALTRNRLRRLEWNGDGLRGKPT